MSIKIPIVIVAYNRANSLQRLLNSLNNAFYDKTTNIELIISIDFSGDNKCCRVAEEFNWGFGPKKVINHKLNLGLKNHILKCGDIALENDGVMIIEDDCFVSKDFYNYALQAFNYYKNDSKIAGISTYSYQFNENAIVPFEPLKDGYDAYFLQVPSSLGQVWSKKQWKAFRDFFDSSSTITEKDLLPINVKNWPTSSWKKFFYKFMVNNGLYFVFPQCSHLTNFGDIGTHFDQQTQNFQVPISNSKFGNYKFCDFQMSNNIYDAFFELLPRCLNNLGFDFNETYTLDTFLTKPLESIRSKYVITTKKTNFNNYLSFNITMKPILNNIIYNNKGEGLYIIETTSYQKEKTEIQPTEIYINQHYLPYVRGHKEGVKSIIKSKAYNIGNKITKVFGFILKSR